MRKRWVILIIVVIVLGALAVEHKVILGAFLNEKSEAVADAPAVKLDYGNLAQAFSGSSMVQDLPENSAVLLRFYNFNSGEREWEKSYILTKGEVKEGYVDNADLIVFIHSKYLASLTNKNFCATVQAAQRNGDFGTESELSDLSLLWKFKGMLKYRTCFGF